VASRQAIARRQTGQVRMDLEWFAWPRHNWQGAQFLLTTDRQLTALYPCRQQWQFPNFCAQFMVICIHRPGKFLINRLSLASLTTHPDSSAVLTGVFTPGHHRRQGNASYVSFRSHSRIPTHKRAQLYDANENKVAFFRPVRPTRYQLGDVYGELHFVTGQSTGTLVSQTSCRWPRVVLLASDTVSSLRPQMHPPLMDMICMTAMAYRVLVQWGW
jgi:hypothetical protein